MSRKVMDCCNRWRSKTVSFCMSPEEDALLDSMVRLSGMTKQDYIIARLLKFEITVQGNPRVYKAMKQELAFLCGRLSESGFLPDSDWAARLDHLLLLLDGMKEV